MAVQLNGTLITGGVTISTPPPAVTGTMQLTYDTSKNSNGPINVPLGDLGDPYTVNAIVDWGDGNTTSAFSTGILSHQYASTGVYTVTITGTTQRFGSANSDNTALTAVNSWDNNLGLISLAYGFEDSPFLTSVPSTLPSGVTNLSHTLSYVPNFNDANVTTWNTSNVTDMSKTFYHATQFNQNIGSWNTAKVTNMNWMFAEAYQFNQNIGGWDTGNVTDMSVMFYYASVFNSNIGGWNTSKVTTMGEMFRNAAAFNQDIGSWSVCNVADMGFMFAFASTFNQNLGTWKVPLLPSGPFGFDFGASSWAGAPGTRPQWAIAC